MSSSNFAPSVFNMVKRLRFSMDEMDIYFEPEEASSNQNDIVATSTNNEAKRKLPKQKEEEKPAPTPNPIKYKDGFPKLLFQDLQDSSASVVLNAAMELDNMLSAATACPEQLQKEFLLLGGHAVLITAMQKWTHHGVIQSHLCRCIGGMIKTFHRGNSEMDLVSSLLLMGALDQITTRALLQYPSFPSIQLDAMHAVSHMCCGKTQSSREAAKHFVRELNGVGLVTKAMKTFGGIEDVQENGCRLLNTLCRAGGHEEAAEMKSKALTVVASSVQAYPDNPSIEKDAHDLMNAVLSGDKEEELD